MTEPPQWAGIAADGLPQGVVVASCGTGPALLLVAGNGGRIAFWNNLAAKLKTRFRLVAIDYSAAPDRDMSGALFETIDRKVDELPLVLDALGLDAPLLLGHSTGAIVVGRFAARQGNRVARLVISGGWPGPHPYLETAFGLRRRIMREIGPEAFLADGLFRSFPPAQLAATLEMTSLETMLSYRGAGDVEIESARIDQILDADLRDAVPAIECHTLVVHAEDDAVFPVTFGQALADEIAGAQFRALPTGAHLAPMAAAADYAAAITPFLLEAVAA